MIENDKNKLVDCYFSFRSPYSYLITPRLRELEVQFGVQVNIKVVLPIAVRIKGFFKKVNPLWPPYLFKDVFRIAERLGMPFAWPTPDPVAVGDDLEALDTQPHIFNLSRAGSLAAMNGRGLEFVTLVSSLIWGGTKNWPEKIEHMLAKSDFDYAQMLNTAEQRKDELDQTIANAQTDLETLGHWGVPTMAYMDEPFFGQDRIEDVKFAIKKQLG